MSQVITNAFETYWQGCLTDQVPVVLDEVVLADIPNLDITAPIDPNTGLPPQAQIVHRHPVDQRGRINNNAVAYSIVMDTTVGNFSFNAMYLINKASGMVGMIVYKGRETKTKTDQATGTTGNSLVKSMLMEYDQAATATVTTVEAGTWQIDYSARLLGMDEQLRLQALACFGPSAFFGDAFKLINKAGAYKVQPGVAMVGGLRIQLDAEQAITVGAKPVGVWVDVHHAGTILSRWDNHVDIQVSSGELTDYVDENGYFHHVTKLATVMSDNKVVDNREVIEHSLIHHIKNIMLTHGFKVFDKAGIYNWTVPENVSRINVLVIGGGGAGGGATASQNYNAAGGGGGAGGYSKKKIRVISGESFAITVGAGGSKSPNGSVAGKNGESSSFGTICSATGGTCGNPAIAATTTSGTGQGNLGGMGVGGDINGRGGSGVAGMANMPTIIGATVGAGHGGESIMGGYGYGAGGEGAATTSGNQVVPSSGGSDGAVIIEW
ncbi:phage tail-collar fiber domain-containing protein [Aeromonas sp. A600620]|uniref:phage tail-collar fiber domain-containing protein n=1 Tax=Aeromonas sp. A600620 TaxID=2712059 RepID=UPI003F8B7A35